MRPKVKDKKYIKIYLNTGFGFSRSGSTLAVYSTQTLHIIDIESCKTRHTLFNKTQGIDILEFSPSDHCVIHTTQVKPQKIMLWNIYLNEVNRIFNLDLQSQEIVENLQVAQNSDLFFATTNSFRVLVFDLASNHSREILLFDYSKIFFKEGYIFFLLSIIYFI